MRRMFAVGVVLVVGLMCTASALAAKPTPTEKRLTAQVAALQKQIPAMQKQIKTLQTQVKELQTISSAALAINICSTAITADALQMTWGTLSAVSSIGAVFGTPESAVNDTGACQAAKVTRQTTGTPNLTAFKALLSIFASYSQS
jgi:hypothetical protein